MQRNPLINSQIETKLLRHLKFIRERVGDLEDIVINEKQGMYEGVSFLTQIQHLFDHIGITLSLVRPDSYVEILNVWLQRMAQNIKTNDDVIRNEFAGKEVSEVKWQPNFGLASNQPLTLDGIIMAAFANPERDKYPDFLSNGITIFNWSNASKYITKYEPIMQISKPAFNNQKIIAC